MKKKISIIFLLLMIQNAAWGHLILDLKTLTTSESKFIPSFSKEVEQLQNGLKITFTLDSVALIADQTIQGANTIMYGSMPLVNGDGIAQVPFNIDNVLVPNLDKCSVEILEDVYTDYPIVVSPARRPALRSEEDPEKSITAIKLIDKFLPEAAASKNKVFEYRESKLMQLMVNPVQYNSKRKTARIHHKISVLVSYGENEVKPEVSEEASIDPVFRSLVTVESLTGQQRVINPTVHENASESYLIISGDSFYKALVPFRRWKKTTGRKVIVKAKSNWTVDDVKKCVRGFYDTYTDAKYVLIVGDTTVVPAAEHYYSHTDTKTGKRLYSYSDLKYFCVKGDDNFPDLYYGRIPVTTSDSLTTVLNKIMSYEKKPNGDVFETRFTSVCMFEGDTATGVERSACFARSVETISQTLENSFDYLDRIYRRRPEIKPKSWSSDTYPGFPFPEHLKNEIWWNYDGGSVTLEFIYGTNIIIQNGHGYYFGWELPEFRTPLIARLKNSIYPIVFNINCESGKYMEPENFAKELLTTSKGGCATTIAATDETLIKSNEHFLLGMMNSLFYGKKFPFYGNFSKKYYFEDENGESTITIPPSSLGEIMNLGFQAVEKNYPSLSGRKAYHCLGDPSINVFWNNKTDLSVSSYAYYSNGMIYAYISPIYNPDNGSQIYGYISFYNSITNTIERYYGNTATFKTNRPAETSVYFSVPGLAPHYISGFETPDRPTETTSIEPYIQNVSFNSDTEVQVILGGEIGTDLELLITESNNIQPVSTTKISANEPTIKYKSNNSSSRLYFVTLKRGNEVLDSKTAYRK